MFREAYRFPMANALNTPPNSPMQLTPLRVPEIRAFLKVRIGSKVVLIY
jgi:hypothetical protein